MEAQAQLRLDGGADVAHEARPEDDYYQTPPWLLEALLRAPRGPAFTSTRARVLDAGAGDGRLGARLFAALAGHTEADALTFVEFDAGRAADLRARFPQAEVIEDDFVAWAFRSQPGRDGKPSGRLFDAIISNPPFRGWEEWVWSALPLLAQDGLLLVHGFVNVVGSEGRYERLWKPLEGCIGTIWLSPKRGSYVAGGGTDQRDSLWISFRRTPQVRIGGAGPEIRWLDPALGREGNGEDDAAR